MFLGTENTIVVLPATPYIFPQRPFIIPSVPPAIVFVDQSLPVLNKPSVPTINRNNGDITKTTMVNILPISAYSHPLSTAKNKKNAIKLKSESTKKILKKLKSPEKCKDIVAIKLNEKSSDTVKCNEKLNVENSDTASQTKTDSCEGKESTTKIMAPSVNSDTQSNPSQEPKSNLSTKDIITNDKDIITTQKNSDLISNTVPISKCTNIAIDNASDTTSNLTPVVNIKSKIEENKTNKSNLSKEACSETKEKDSKLTNILDQPLCDSAIVDGGNARLELAEEFLAASPTAAFLMSFPLVSGNRADSPADEANSVQTNLKDVSQKRNDGTSQQGSYFDKPAISDSKTKVNSKTDTSMHDQDKSNDQHKCVTSVVNKHPLPKISAVTHIANVTSENPFISLSMPSLVTTSCTLTDSTFTLDFDCNLSKPVPSQSTNFSSTSNLFYKNDPFSTVKNTIYSTSSISSNHDFNSLMYPCAMEKYSTKNKSDFVNMEDSLMKIGSSRLTYDIDLGWSHKSFDFVNCTTSSNTLTKDNILPTSSVSYSSSYNPFNPEFHVPLVSNSNKRDGAQNKPTSSFPETITSFYSQATNLWSEDIPFYSSSNITKASNKHQNYLNFDQANTNSNVKTSVSKHYEMKDVSEPALTNSVKPTNVNSGQGLVEKYTKKSPNKMHINWMTSEIRPMQTNCNSTLTEIKSNHKPSYNNSNQKTLYNNLDNINKKVDHNEGNYFPISMHNCPSQAAQEEFQVWPSTRPVGTAEVSIEPPPINLPTLVGDLALGPHDKKKNADLSNRVIPNTDIQNCGNFLSVTQLMNRSTDHSRYQAANIDLSKSIAMKQNVANYPNNHHNRKLNSSRSESNATEPYYVLNDPKVINNYENVPQYPQVKPKTNNKPEKTNKTQKNSYSAEALIQTGNGTQKIQDGNHAKFMMTPTQKYNDFTVQESGMAQISHYPPIIDYSENGYVSQQFSGTTLYNTTTNTITNSFYSNFMPGTSNLITSNYTTGPFTSDFTDYNQNTECNYSNHKYEDLKMRNNSMVCPPEKGSSNYKISRRESATKHKLDCTKKESNKKNTKRTKLNSEAEEWVDPNLMLWQNRSSSKRHPNLISEDLPFPNYVSNQMPTQYQTDFFNSHLMSSNMQNMSHNVDRSITSFPVTSRANFNLSTIFPEITMVRFIVIYYAWFFFVIWLQPVYYTKAFVLKPRFC